MKSAGAGGSPPMESTGDGDFPPPIESIGDGTVRVRLYRRSVEDGTLVAVAELDPVAPPRPLGGGAASPVVEVDAEPHPGSGLYLALVQDGIVFDLALLCFSGGRPVGDDYEVLDISSTEPEEEEEGASFDFSRLSFSVRQPMREHQEGNHNYWEEQQYEASEEEEQEEEGHGEENLTSEEEVLDLSSGQEEEEKGASFDFSRLSFSVRQPMREHQEGNYNYWEEQQYEASEEEEQEEEGHGEENLTSAEEEQEGEEDVQKQGLQIKLRTWLSRRTVLVKVYRGKRWILTKQYVMVWLQHAELEELSSQSCFKMGFGAPSASTMVSRNLNCVMDFEVTAIVSPILDELINDVLKPSMADFKIIGKLYGEAGDCRVFKCIFLGSECAIKAVSQEVACSTEPREIEIISNLRDKRVMTFYQAWVESWSYKQRPEKEYIIMHLEFCPRTLKNALLCKGIENHQWFIFEEIVRGVNFLHGESVVHRDLKPDNIFFGSDWGIRIGDFGDSCIGYDEFGLCGGTPGCGTTYYLAPELDSGEKITEKVDIYSTGVIFLELFSSFTTGMERREIFEKLRQEGAPKGWKGDSEFLNKLIASEPSNRPSAADILEHIEQQRQVDTSSAADFLQQLQVEASSDRVT